MYAHQSRNFTSGHNSHDHLYPLSVLDILLKIVHPSATVAMVHCSACQSAAITSTWILFKNSIINTYDAIIYIICGATR